MKILQGTCTVPMASGVPWAVVLALTCLTGLPCGASVVNGTFDLGLSGWTVVGDVQAVTEASLGDTGADYSLLYQGVPLAPGCYRIEFDFRNLLSADLPADGSGFPDTLFASLYFIDDLGSFDLAGSVFDSVDPLMDLDASGPFNVAGTLGTSVLGPEWTHFTFDFTNNFAYVIPTFELLDFNTIAGDSAVQVDNVAILPCPVIPEPGTLTLCALALTGWAAARKHRPESM